MEKIKVIETVSRVDRVASEDESITACVRTERGKVAGVDSGRVISDGIEQAQFTFWSGGRLEVIHNFADNRAATLSAVEEFIADLQEGGVEA